MLRKIILLCFLLSGFLFSQQYSNDKYEKYIGTELGKYPLTVTGLKKAIAALDSGIVYIAYPGLWDTTGLGQIPNKIALHGFLFGNMTYTLNDTTNLRNKIFWSDTPGEGNWQTYDDAERSYSPFTFTSRQESWWATLSSYNFLDRWSRRIKQSGSRLMAGDFIVNFDSSYKAGLGGLPPAIQGLQVIASIKPDSQSSTPYYGYYRGIGAMIGYRQPYQTEKLFDLITVGANMDFYSGSDTVWALNPFGIRNYNSRFHYETGVYFNTNVISYLSDLTSTLQSRLITGNTAYHFYASGNYPSWFAGTVNSGAGYNYSADTSSTDAYKIVLAGAHTLTAGLEVTFKALTTNDSSATLQINALTAKALTKASSGAVNTSLATGDILAGQIVKCVYDGAQFQVISRLAQ